MGQAMGLASKELSRRDEPLLVVPLRGTCDISSLTFMP